LLACNNCYRALLRQLFERRAIAILLAKGRDQCGAPIGRELHFACGAFEDTGV
jgi:hypothetical protein